MTNKWEGGFDSNGKMHGVWKYRYDDGQLKYTIQYVHGITTGPLKYWYNNGKEMDFSYWKLDSREGEQLEFFYNNDTIENETIEIN